MNRLRVLLRPAFGPTKGAQDVVVELAFRREIMRRRTFRQVSSGALDAGYNLTDAGALRYSLFEIDLGKGHGRLRYIGAAIGKAAGAGHFEAASDQQAARSD